jgi:hypothetical protein
MSTEYSTYSGGNFDSEVLLGPLTEIDTGDGTALSTITNATNKITIDKDLTITGLMAVCTELTDSTTVNAVIALVNSTGVVICELTIPDALAVGNVIMTDTVVSAALAELDDGAVVYLGLKTKGTHDAGNPEGKVLPIIRYKPRYVQ